MTHYEDVRRQLDWLDRLTIPKALAWFALGSTAIWLLIQWAVKNV